MLRTFATLAPLMPELGEDRRIASDIFGRRGRFIHPLSFRSHVRARRRGEFQCRIIG
jgi:hypothetical protein